VGVGVVGVVDVGVVGVVGIVGVVGVVGAALRAIMKIKIKVVKRRRVKRVGLGGDCITCEGDWPGWGIVRIQRDLMRNTKGFLNFGVK
jgi:hypothetical protein